jgi:stearoyl-CoA desaturase (delta-9 desaturase)
MTAVSLPAPETGAHRTRGKGLQRDPEDRVHFWSSLPFFLVNLSPLLIVFTGVSWKSLGLLLINFWVRMFFITAGYHRYFSHRTYRLARFPQFLLAFGGTTAAQKGPLWWAAHHRDHHRFSDTQDDIHSPQKGFWWSHVGWILCERHAGTKFDRIKDFAAYPELRFLNKYDWIGPWLLGITCYLIDGWRGLVVGFFTSTVLLWHSTFFINSLAHVFGRRRYATEDTSRNSFLLALLTMGEGWHNNHHYWASSCRNGFFWWEWDPTYYTLKALSWVGIVKDIKSAPSWARHANRVKDGSFDIGMFRLSWNRAARAVHNATAHVGELVLEKRAHAREAIAEKRTHAGEAIAEKRGSLAEKRQAIEMGLQQRKQALEQFVTSSMESAEELAKASRRVQREMASDAG